MNDINNINEISKEQDIVYLQETTDWSQSGLTVPNHIYIVDKKTGWLVGFIQSGTGTEKMFNFPYKTFNKKERTFKDVTKLMGW